MDIDISQRNTRGYSLIELILVITIISLVSTASFFLLRNATIDVEGQAQQLANDLRYAQSLAMTKGQRYRWVKLSASTYQIQNNAGTAITLAQGNTTVTFNSGITFGTLTNLPNNLVAFDGNGAPYTDTAIPGTALASSASIPLTSGTDTTTVVVSPGTGRVLVQ
jgi:MSHA pilin protein MshC